MVLIKKQSNRASSALHLEIYDGQSIVIETGGDLVAGTVPIYFEDTTRTLEGLTSKIKYHALN